MPGVLFLMRKERKKKENAHLLSLCTANSSVPLVVFPITFPMPSMLLWPIRIKTWTGAAATRALPQTRAAIA